MKKLTKAILVAILVRAAGCETFKEPQDDTVWFDLNVVGYPCVTLGGQQIIDSGELYNTVAGVSIGMFGAKERNMYGLQAAPIGTVSENLGGAQVGFSILLVAGDYRSVCLTEFMAIGAECRLASSIGLTMVGFFRSSTGGSDNQQANTRRASKKGIDEYAIAEESMETILAAAKQEVRRHGKRRRPRDVCIM